MTTIEVKKTKDIGLGSLSFVLCLLGILFTFEFGDKSCMGDHILHTIGISGWSNGDSSPIMPSSYPTLEFSHSTYPFTKNPIVSSSSSVKSRFNPLANSCSIKARFPRCATTALAHSFISLSSASISSLVRG